MQSYCDAHRLAFRPHVKTHKLPEIARMQLDAGAVGITCQKLGEAEVMVDAGFDDVLVTFPLVGPQKAQRLAALAHRVTMTVVGDSAVVAQGLSDVLAREGLEVDFLVDCDTGFARTGVQTPRSGGRPGGARRRARRPSLRRSDDVPDPVGERAVAARGACGDRGARPPRREGQRRRNAHGSHDPRDRRGDGGPRRHVRLRGPRLYRERVGSPGGLCACGSSPRW